MKRSDVVYPKHGVGFDKFLQQIAIPAVGIGSLVFLNPVKEVIEDGNKRLPRDFPLILRLAHQRVVLVVGHFLITAKIMLSTGNGDKPASALRFRRRAVTFELKQRW